MLYNCEIVSGVYTITDTRNGNQYVGSSKNIYARWDKHQQDLKYNKHHSPRMLRIYNKYGAGVLEFKLLLECEVKDLILYEQRAIDVLKPVFNGSKIAGRIEHTPEVHKRISEKCIAAYTPERRAAKSAALKGKRPTIDLGILSTPEHRAKLREAHRSKHRKFEYQGRMWSLKEAAEHFGIKYGMLKDRVSRFGWDFATAIETPKRKGGL